MAHADPTFTSRIARPCGPQRQSLVPAGVFRRVDTQRRCLRAAVRSLAVSSPAERWPTKGCNAAPAGNSS
jgi:hypothetical protein